MKGSIEKDFYAVKWNVGEAFFLMFIKERFLILFSLKLTDDEFIKLERKRWRLVWEQEELLRWTWMLRCIHRAHKLRSTRSWYTMELLLACTDQLVHWCLPTNTISKWPFYRWLWKTNIKLMEALIVSRVLAALNMSHGVSQTREI